MRHDDQGGYDRYDDDFDRPIRKKASDNTVLWVVLAGTLLLAASRLTPSGRGLLLLLVGQLGIYGVAFVFSDWQPYTAHVQTSLDRLLVQTVPLALLLLVENVSTLAAGRATAVGHAAIPSRGMAAR